MDDIAWLSLRATQEPFTDFPMRLREYEELSGNPIDEARVRYYQVMAEAKLQVMSHRPPKSPRETSRPRGGTKGETLETGSSTEFSTAGCGWRHWLSGPFDRTDSGRGTSGARPTGARMDVRRTAQPAARCGRPPYQHDPPLAKGAQAKGLARIIKYLGQVDAYGDFYESCELQDLLDLLGYRPPTVALGRTEVSKEILAGSISDTAYLQYLWRRIARETELARPAMGALADRHWPALRRKGEGD